MFPCTHSPGLLSCTHTPPSRICRWERLSVLQKLQRGIKSRVEFASLFESLNDALHATDPVSQAFLVSAGIGHENFDLVSQITMSLTKDVVPDQLLGRLVDKRFC